MDWVAIFIISRSTSGDPINAESPCYRSGVCRKKTEAEGERDARS